MLTESPIPASHLDAALWVGGESRRLAETYLECLGYDEGAIDAALSDYADSCEPDARPQWAR